MSFLAKIRFAGAATGVCAFIIILIARSIADDVAPVLNRPAEQAAAVQPAPLNPLLPILEPDHVAEQPAVSLAPVIQPARPLQLPPAGAQFLPEDNTLQLAPVVPARQVNAATASQAGELARRQPNQPAQTRPTVQWNPLPGGTVPLQARATTASILANQKGHLVPGAVPTATQATRAETMVPIISAAEAMRSLPPIQQRSDDLAAHEEHLAPVVEAMAPVKTAAESAPVAFQAAPVQREPQVKAAAASQPMVVKNGFAHEEEEAEAAASTALAGQPGERLGTADVAASFQTERAQGEATGDSAVVHAQHDPSLSELPPIVTSHPSFNGSFEQPVLGPNGAEDSSADRDVSQASHASGADGWPRRRGIVEPMGVRGPVANGIPAMIPGRLAGNRGFDVIDGTPPFTSGDSSMPGGVPTFVPDGSQDAPIVSGQQFLPGQPMIQGLPEGAVTQPGVLVVNSGGAPTAGPIEDTGYIYSGRYFEADALYWTRDNGEIFGANFNAVDLWPWDLGGRITLGRRWDSMDGHEISYLGITPLIAVTSQANAAGLLTGNFSGSTTLPEVFLTSFRNSTFMEQLQKTDLHSLELNRVWFQWDTSATYVGFRYIYFDDQFRLHSRNLANEVGVYRIDTTNHMAGVHVGLDLVDDIGRRIYFSYFGKIGAFANYNRGTTYLSNDGAVILNAGSRRTNFAWNIDFGVLMHVYLARNLRARLGYQFLVLFDVATTEDNFREVLTSGTGFVYNDNGDAFFHGASLGLEWKR